jgi:uncharacterized membrane protein YebE (DUF533 family)
MGGRVQDWIDALEVSGAALTDTHPADDALLAMLVHAALSSGDVGASQFDLLRRVVPTLTHEQALALVAAEVRQPMNFEGLLMALPEPDDHQRLLKLATTMVDSDEHINTHETNFLRQLQDALDNI